MLMLVFRRVQWLATTTLADQVARLDQRMRFDETCDVDAVNASRVECLPARALLGIAGQLPLGRLPSCVTKRPFLIVSMSRPKAQARAQCLELDTRIGEFWHPVFQEGAQFLHLRRFVGIFRSDEVIRVTTSNGGLKRQQFSPSLCRRQEVKIWNERT
ncbi:MULTISPECIES: hypothetical protein [unclassified Paraburkholderia]|uniref:hypothetical protein n=1 Tax=unclassified Paraburkholderia TaxID=2615204 RepID=UPI0016099F52|nr:MULTISPECIES: hypothetical protein [unclassified Paraburkholderia]MBB5448117.1 hypothetical protein [Paraburkholderia sp. WSM4177]MBB5488507.1 hypothetical protein [Paraburkholderia sp. WSM4180]